MPRDKTGHFYYAWFPTIYEQDTQHLSLGEDGAYRRLIDHYMITRAALPCSEKALARIVGCGMDEWAKISMNILSFFKAKDGLYHHDFCDDTINGDTARILRAQENGRKSKKLNDCSNEEITHWPPSGVTQPNQPKTTHNKSTQINGKGQGEGFSHSSGLGNGVRYVPSLETAQRLLDVTPGWDQNMLIEKYNSWKGKNGMPTANHPDAAFIGWAKSFTKGKRPA